MDRGTILHCMGVTLLHRITQLQRIMYIYKKTFMMNRKMRIHAYSLFSLKELLPVMVVNMLSYFTRKVSPLSHTTTFRSAIDIGSFVSFHSVFILLYFISWEKRKYSSQGSLRCTVSKVVHCKIKTSVCIIVCIQVLYTASKTHYCTQLTELHEMLLV